MSEDICKAQDVERFNLDALAEIFYKQFQKKVRFRSISEVITACHEQHTLHRSPLEAPKKEWGFEERSDKMFEYKFGTCMEWIKEHLHQVEEILDIGSGDGLTSLHIQAALKARKLINADIENFLAKGSTGEFLQIKPGERIEASILPDLVLFLQVGQDVM
jgi:hypothetical protein